MQTEQGRVALAFSGAAMMDWVSILPLDTGRLPACSWQPMQTEPQARQTLLANEASGAGDAARDSREPVSSGAVTLFACSPGAEHLKMLIQLNRAPRRKRRPPTDAS